MLIFQGVFESRGFPLGDPNKWDSWWSQKNDEDEERGWWISRCSHAVMQSWTKRVTAGPRCLFRSTLHFAKPSHANFGSHGMSSRSQTSNLSIYLSTYLPILSYPILSYPSYLSTYVHAWVPSRELTYPTLGTVKSSSKIDFSGEMSFPRGQSCYRLIYLISPVSRVTAIDSYLLISSFKEMNILSIQFLYVHNV